MVLRTVNSYSEQYRPGQAVRALGGSGSQISKQSAHKGCNVVSPTHRPPLPPRRYSWCLFLSQVKSRFQRHSPAGIKIPMTVSGIEPTTFRLVAQCPVINISYNVFLLYVLAGLSKNKTGQTVRTLNLYSGYTRSESRQGHVQS
jgi:hypothetical protein